MSITEKTAYLKGLLEGMALDQSKPETKLISAVIDALNDIALELDAVEDDMDTLKDYALEIDEDLGDVEDYIFGEDPCEDCEFCDDDYWYDEDCDHSCKDCDIEDCDEREETASSDDDLEF